LFGQVRTKGANGPTRKAIQNQTLGDLLRSRAISAENGIEANETVRKSHHIRQLSQEKPWTLF